MLRLLAVVGVFEAHGSLWAYTERSRLTRSDHPQSMRPYIRMMGGPMFWAAAGELEAEAILRSVRRCAPKHAELLVLESILPEGSGPHHIADIGICFWATSDQTTGLW